MDTFNNQKGITLLEVLIGFVIFTSSLVAILDYVGTQVYLSHLTDQNQRRAQLVYELNSVSGQDESEQAEIITSYQNMDISVISEAVDKSKDGKKTSTLIQTHYSVGNSRKMFEWTVIEVR